MAKKAAPSATKRVSKKTGKTYYYDPEAAKKRREELKAYAIAGGYTPKPRRVGAGVTIQKTSKTGKTYYYTPWASLTPEQKEARLDYARQEREYARRYKEEHGIGKKE